MTTVAVWLLTLCGLALVAIGGYFILARPALLPEDARFMGTTPRFSSRPRRASLGGSSACSG